MVSAKLDADCSSLITMATTLANSNTFGWGLVGIFFFCPVMTKNPKSQNCMPTYYRLFCFGHGTGASVRDENLRAYLRAHHNFSISYLLPPLPLFLLFPLPRIVEEFVNTQSGDWEDSYLMDMSSALSLFCKSGSPRSASLGGRTICPMAFSWTLYSSKIRSIRIRTRW